jgi:hypothetical protein
MENDPLAKYRRTPPAPQGGIMRRNDGDEYAAFGTKDKVHRLRICSLSEPVHAPGYNMLLDVVSDPKGGTYCILVFTVLLVKLQGANLQKMVFAIENSMCDFVQEFDSERWQKPTAADAPLIESIEVRITDTGSRYEDMKH